MRSRTVAACAIVLCVLSQRAHACSLMLADEFLDGFVFYGEVVGHVESTYRSRQATGIRVVPRHEFRIPAPAADGDYDIYPMDLEGDCSLVPAGRVAPVVRQFEIGSVVAVVARDASDVRLPGDIAPTALGLLYVVAPSCYTQALVRRAHDYAQTQIACGYYRFEANKDIALLDSAPPAQRIEILTRLAHYASELSYIDLVAKFVPDRVAAGRLLAARYADINGSDCFAPLSDERWARLSRLGEFCRQKNPYEPRPGDEWDLAEAIERDRMEVVQGFLRQGGDPNRRIRTPDGYYSHPLRVAVIKRREGIAIALLEAGAEFESSEISIVSVAQAGLAKLMDYLLAQDPRRLEGELGMGGACSQGHYDIVDVTTRHIVERGMDLGRAFSDALDTCILSVSTDAARLLLKRGANISDSTLSVAARANDVGMVRTLLALGADPFRRYRDSSDPRNDGSAPIDFAWLEYEYKSPEAQRRAAYVLYELASVGPPLKGRERLDGIPRNGIAELERYGDPAEKLVAAARTGFYDVVEKMSAEGEGTTRTALRDALHAALRSHHADIARLLLEQGADPRGGALQIAAQTGPADMVSYLVRLGADPNAAVNGITPIASWYAGERAHNDLDVLPALLDSGADPCVFINEAPPAPAFDTLRYHAVRCER